MERKIITAIWNSQNLNDINTNFKYLFEGINNAYALTTSVRALQNDMLSVEQSVLDLKNLNVLTQETLDEAKRVNQENLEVQQAIDNLILSDGESDAEVIQARGEFPLLYERLDDLDDRNKNTVIDFESIGNKPQDFLTNYSDHVVSGDWTAAMEAALQASDNVVIPRGANYVINDVEVPSGKSVYAQDGVKIETTGSSTFKTQGSFSEPIPVALDVLPHSRKVTVTDATGLSVGDDILIQSQRNALNIEDSTNEWCLGRPHTDGQVLPFGEYNEITEINGNEITLARNLIYPSYLSSSINELEPAQNTATVTKVDFAENISIRNMRINKSSAGAAVNVHTSKHVQVDDIFMDNTGYSSGYSNAVYFTFSYMCEASNCRYFIPATTPFDTIDLLNPFKIASSMMCGYNNCKVENASQAFDMSFLAGNFPNTLCYYTNNKSVNARTSGMTTHGGNYMSKITGNIVLGTHQGISHRGRSALIDSNIFLGDRDRQGILSYGIGMYGGQSVDTTITNNVVRNFNQGIGHFDDSGDEGRVSYSGTNISNNHIFNCNKGVTVYRLYTGNVSEDYMGIIIKNNTIRMTEDIHGRNVVGVDILQTSRGVIVSGNTFKGIPSGRKTLHFGVRTEKNVSEIKITDNTFIDLSYGVNNNKQKDADGMMTSIIRDNEYINVDFGVVEDQTYVRNPLTEDDVVLHDPSGAKYGLDVNASGEIRLTRLPINRNS